MYYSVDDDLILQIVKDTNLRVLDNREKKSINIVPWLFLVLLGLILNIGSYLIISR